LLEAEVAKAVIGAGEGDSPHQHGCVCARPRLLQGDVGVRQDGRCCARLRTVLAATFARTKAPDRPDAQRPIYYTYISADGPARAVEPGP